jgi:hypothetical protein
LSKLAVLLSIVLFSVWACGSGGGTPAPTVSVTLSPGTANVHVTRTLQFTATVHNATNSAVTWTLSGTGCSGASCGTISSGGLYTAPASVPSPATVRVIATSMADSSKSATATVTVMAAVIITISPAAPSVNIGSTEQFTASVQNAADSSVTWTISGTGCSGASCGTVSTSGLYTAPSTVPSPPAVTIKATSVEDTATFDSTTVTVVSPVSVFSWPTKAQVTFGATHQFGAIVSGTTDTSVTWSVSGAGCSGAACGTISNTGLYTAPASVPTPETVTVTVTSQVDPGKSASATVEIMPDYNSKLNGTYSYLYQGFALDVPGITCGTFTADGQGHITYGVTDRTWLDYVGGNLLNASFTGTYSIGYDNRGTLYLSSAAFGSVTLAFVLDAAGDMCFIQPFFDVSTRLLGTFVKQDVSVFDNSGVQGDYVFQWLGATYGSNRLGALGRLHTDGFGNISSGTLDINDGTSAQTGLGLTGTYSVSGNGRGTLTLTISSLGTFHYVIYVLTSDSFFMSSTDDVTSTVPMWSGTALKQSGGPFSNASLLGTGVFDLLGRPAADQATASVGLMTSDGNGGITGLADINTNGALSANTAYLGTYSIGVDGRGTFSSSTLPGMIFYIVSPGKAFLMEAPGAAVQLGSLEPQVQLTYGTGALLGQFVEGTGVPPYAANQVLTAVLWYDSAGNISWDADVNSSVGGLVSGTGSGVVASVAANGRGVLTDAFGNHGYLYLVSPLKFVEIQGPIPQQTMPDQNLLFRNIRRP